MTPEVMSHIFDPLYTTKDRGHGTGLGFVIVSQIVSEHGGRVEVESELGKGTRFRLTFAAIPNDVPVVVEEHEPELEVGIDSMKHILVVDDDQDSCDLLREIFCAEGWHVDTALSPSQAFSVAEKEKIDLVVSDVNLEANQSGLDLLKDLRAQCPVILVTGFGTLDSAVEAAREGAWDFISKPFKVQEVVAIARTRSRAGSK